LIGIEVCLDWSQLGVPRPQTVGERLESVYTETGAIRERIAEKLGLL
jgi:hypothetical protein